MGEPSYLKNGVNKGKLSSLEIYFSFCSLNNFSVASYIHMYRVRCGYFIILKNHNTKNIGNIDLIIFSVYKGTFKVLF